METGKEGGARRTVFRSWKRAVFRFLENAVFCFLKKKGFPLQEAIAASWCGGRGYCMTYVVWISLNKIRSVWIQFCLAEPRCLWRFGHVEETLDGLI